MNKEAPPATLGPYLQVLEWVLWRVNTTAVVRSPIWLNGAVPQGALMVSLNLPTPHLRVP